MKNLLHTSVGIEVACSIGIQFAYHRDEVNDQEGNTAVYDA